MSDIQNDKVMPSYADIFAELQANKLEEEKAYREEMRTKGDRLQAEFLSRVSEGCGDTASRIDLGDWDGGNDSGSVNLQDCEQLSEEVIAAIERAVYDRLDYGGWAGEFSSRGDVYYDPERNLIVLDGTEVDETKWEEIDSDEVTIPCTREELACIAEFPEDIDSTIESIRGTLSTAQDSRMVGMEELSLLDIAMIFRFHDGPVPASWLATKEALRDTVDELFDSAVHSHSDEYRCEISLTPDEEKECIVVKISISEHLSVDIHHELELYEIFMTESDE